MSHNTTIGVNNLAGNVSRLPVLIVLLGIASVTACRLMPAGWRSTPTVPLPTQTAEASLTDKYGMEVRAAIEDFEFVWGSLIAHQEPSVQSDVATGRYLELKGYDVDVLRTEPFWLVVTSAEVVSLRVTSYSSDRFKAVATTVRTIDKVLPDGRVVDTSVPNNPVCAVYVFIQAEGKWKLVGRGLTFGPPDEVARDWERYLPDWHKEILGEIPAGELCAWFEDFY